LNSVFTFNLTFHTFKDVIAMLVFARKKGEEILFPDLGITIKIIRFKSGNIVAVGVDAPTNIRVHRREVFESMQEHGERFQSAPLAVVASSGKTEPVRIWAKPRPVTGQSDSSKSQTAGEQEGDHQS
jgi:carbon storage regulator CsrA